MQASALALANLGAIRLLADDVGRGWTLRTHLGSETDARAYVCPSGVGGIRFAHRHLGSGDSSQAS